MNKLKWERVRSLLWDKRIYFLVFAVPALIMYIAYALFEVHPFGDNSVLVLDLNGQYVYYYEALRDAFWGDGSLVYSWSRNLSGEMFGIFAYYLASPFMLIVCLLPRTAMCGAIELMQIAKIGAAAVTFAYFLRKTGKPRNTSLAVFSSCYALMSYMVVQLMDPMWLDGLIYLPLICWGVHRLVDEGKLLPLIIPLALMFIAHFYIGYMVGFFTFCYFIYYCLSREGRILPKHIFRRIVQFGAAAVTAVMTAGVVLIPVYNSLKLGKLEFSTPDFSLATQFDFLTFITKLFPMSYDTVYPEGLPMIFCGSAVLLLVPLFFMNAKISVKEKVSKGLLLLVLFVSMYIAPIDIAWHGFQVPNWLPYRYSFAFSFLLLLMAYRAFENLDGITAKEIGGVFFGLMVFLFWCERENYSHFQIFEGRTENGETKGVIQGIWFSIIALSVYFALLYLYRKRKSSKAVCVILCMLVGLELLANTMDTLHKIDVDVVYSEYTSYEPYMSDTRDAVEHIKEFDDSPFFRMEATFHRTVNDPIGTGYYGISHSSSTMNSPALKALQQLGYAYGGHYTKYDGSTYLTDALFGIRYLMDKEDYDASERYSDQRTSVPEEYTLVTHIDEQAAKYKFYENPYELGLGVVSSSKIQDVRLIDANPFENQNNVFNALISQTEDTSYFTRILPHSMETENMQTSSLADGHTKYYPADQSIAECHIDYVVRMDKDSNLYMYLPTKYERSCNVWIQKENEYLEGTSAMEYAGQFFVGDNYSILNLGKFYQDEDIRIRITVANDDNEAFWSEALFYSFDMKAFEAADAQLQERVWNVTRHEDTYVEGTCTAESGEEVLFTTIPYENGWIVKVNGKEADIGKSLDSLITIPLEKGENVITMEFAPNYFTAAKIISVCGLIIIVLIFMFEYKNGRLVKKFFEKPQPKSAADAADVKPIIADDSKIDKTDPND
ncbi:YfhO family protein [Ruminococcus sp. Marseille-P6503]|uniref:YfhO family protein n=1 Tax=Ruminococcus sp. Marseille-P6503 TaxID=2364796 RepID=UPI001FAA1CB0|nr:YfhO family protein [Ruminococcus sp. Marseille-P6503]